jgi:hypothetical protein
LEKRYLHAQRESTSLHDLNSKLEQELKHKEAQLKVLYSLATVEFRLIIGSCFKAARGEMSGGAGEA